MDHPKDLGAGQSAQYFMLDRLVQLSDDFDDGAGGSQQYQTRDEGGWRAGKKVCQ